LNGLIKSGGGGSLGTVLDSTDYRFDASAKTITLLGEYASAELPQIISIKNTSKGLQTIYDSNNPATFGNITYAAPVITVVNMPEYKGDAYEDTDSLQIIINKE
jgi:hypothetical protein